MSRTERFGFDFDSRYAGALGLLGVRPHRCYVEVDDRELCVRFGPWRVRTPRSNVVAAHIGGPYAWWKVIGVRVSLADLGLTFGSSPRRGVCLELRTPVRGVEPLGLLRHRGVTVTVADPEGLAAGLGF